MHRAVPPLRASPSHVARGPGWPLLLLLLLALPACDDGASLTDPDDGEPVEPGEPPSLEDLDLVFVEVVELARPVALAAPPGDDRFFVAEQTGEIRIVRRGEVLPEPFLDLSARTEATGERGLLGLAFHPEYAQNGRFFVNFTDLSGDTRLVEYRVSGDPDRADTGSERELLFLEQPFGNHNGGHLDFGPDGMLYMSTGDGGGASGERAQDPDVLHGSILRLDVATPGEIRIPPDNPFAGEQTEGRGEIWAMGLRNPWRFSFDAEQSLLYIGDVGERAWEEVNVAPLDAGGLNYGWPIFEGPECIAGEGCDRGDLVLPVVAYPHPQGCAVIGGHVYRGEAIPALHGHYVYSDLCGRWLRSFRFAGGEAEDEREWDAEVPGQVTSMGRDAGGELYALSANGWVYRLEADETGGGDGG